MPDALKQIFHADQLFSVVHARSEIQGEGIWLASFTQYDLGYFDLEQKTLQPLDNPFGTPLSPMS